MIQETPLMHHICKILSEFKSLELIYKFNESSFCIEKERRKKKEKKMYLECFTFSTISCVIYYYFFICS